jgi:hypothetical protein
MADHYVDSAAAPGGDGSIGAPWDTLADVEAHALVPGDNVYIKRGSTFAEQLRINHSGTSGNPINYQAYDVGNRPIITGGGGNGISTEWTENYNYIFLEDLRVDSCAEASILMSRSIGWVIEGCAITNPAKYGIRGRAVFNSRVSNCTFTGNRALLTGWAGIFFYSESTTYVGYGNTVENCVLNYWAGYAIDFMGVDKDYRTHGNACIGNDLSSSLTGCYFHFVDGSIMRGNTCNDNLAGGYAGEEYGLAIETGSDNEIDHNTCTDGRVGLEIFGWTGGAFPNDGPSERNFIHHNEFSGNTEHGVQLQSGNLSGTRFERNILFDNNWAGLAVSDGNVGYESTNCTIYNNSFCCNDKADAGYGDLHFGYVCAGWTWRANAFYNTNRKCFHSVPTTQTIHSKNCFYRAAGSVIEDNAATYTLAQVTAFEADGIGADPLYISAVAPFNLDLQVGSATPCWNAGIPGIGGALDYLGRPIT